MNQVRVTKESVKRALPGLPMLLVFLVAILGCFAWIVMSARAGQPAGAVLGVLGLLGSALLAAGLFTVNPNEGKVLQLFGAYRGTAREEGLRWANPFLTKRRVSLRVRNFETNKLKVNDKRGNPIEIGAVVVWQVVDTAEAVFQVDNYENYVHVQSEAALRTLASSYPYDSHGDGEVDLVGHTAEVSQVLKAEVQERLSRAGVEVLEARISYLAYAQEIAAAMLQRQQATAVVAARHKIVEGAVGMVEMALDQLSKQKILELDEERKAAMVSNLLVVLCSDRHTQPVVNTGSLYN